jgi:hypothetical protein
MIIDISGYLEQISPTGLAEGQTDKLIRSPTERHTDSQKYRQTHRQALSKAHRKTGT